MVDNNTPTKKFQKELNAGIASLLLLSVIGRSDEPMYGYQIAKVIEIDDEVGLSMKQSAFYPVLRSLENNGLLESRVEPSTSGPPRRYYTITAQGHQTLAEWQRIWQNTLHYVNTVLEGDFDV